VAKVPKGINRFLLLNIMAKGCKSKKATSTTAKLLAMFLAIGLLAVLGTAGLLSYYGKVVGTVTVSQSILVDGQVYSDTGIQETITAYGGETKITPHYIKAVTTALPAKVKITLDNPATTDVETAPEGVTVKYLTATWTDNDSDGVMDTDEYQCGTNEIAQPVELTASSPVVPFCIQYSFAINYVSPTGGDTITTYVVPVTS